MDWSPVVDIRLPRGKGAAVSNAQKCAVTISRWTGAEADGVQIEIRDDASRTVLVQVSMDVHEFANALFALGHRPGTITHWYPNLMGMTCEGDEVDVPLPKNQYATHAIDLKPYEVDGWICRADDANNSHRWFEKNGSLYARVRRHRYINPATGRPVILPGKGEA